VIARVSACWLALATVLAAQEAPPLPEWRADDLAALKPAYKASKPAKNAKKGKAADEEKPAEPAVPPLIPGAELLTGERPLEEAGEPISEPMAYVAPAPGEISDEARPPVPESFWGAYFAERPKTFLVDPQKLLSPSAATARLEFLNYHAGDSSIDLFVYLFDGPQEIPGEVRAEELIERCFATGRPAAVVFYYLGAPERAQWMLSPSIAEVISPAEQRRTLQSVIAGAAEKTHPAEQLEAFTLQMSIRLYWMERVMKGGAEAAVETAAPAASVAKEEKDDRKARLLAMARPWAMPAGAGAGGVLLLVLLGVAWKARARYRFPEFDVEPRLGGDHAAGIGAVISFSSPTLPPGRQRELPDYLRRM